MCVLAVFEPLQIPTKLFIFCICCSIFEFECVPMYRVDHSQKSTIALKWGY